jgi:hypothetical protein
MCCDAFFVIHMLSLDRIDELMIWRARIAAAAEVYVFSSSQVVPQKGVSRIRCHFSPELFLILMPFCANGCWLLVPGSSSIVISSLIFLWERSGFAPLFSRNFVVIPVFFCPSVHSTVLRRENRSIHNPLRVCS